MNEFFTLPTAIKSESDIYEFFRYLLTVVKEDFHPDNHFHDYKDSTGTHLFDANEVKTYSKLMSECFSFAGQTRISEIGVETYKEYLCFKEESALRIACHEAGHVIVGKVRKLKLRYVTIKKGFVEINGLTLNGPVATYGGSPEPFDLAPFSDWVVNECVCLAGGYAAEYLCFRDVKPEEIPSGNSDRYGIESAYPEKYDAVCSYFGVSKDDKRPKFEWMECFRHAHDILNGKEKVLRLLADRLLEEQTMEGKVVEEFVESLL